jgi:hypothetical protein
VQRKVEFNNIVENNSYSINVLSFILENIIKDEKTRKS